MNIKKITEYLYNCRWCNFKEDIRQGKVSNISFEKMPFDNDNKLFVIGEVLIENGEPKYFSMPLAKKDSMPENQNAIVLDGAIYTDALVEPDFYQSLMSFINENGGKVRFSNGWTLARHDIGDAQLIDECLNEPSKALGVEQSNTTLNVGHGKLAFKLERMLEFSNEVNSELEMNEKLMREGCQVMPKSFGGLVWTMPDGRQASSGIMQEFVRNKGDMWNYLLDYLDPKLADGYLHQRDLTADNNPEFMAMIRNLSEKTSEMGECLSRPDENPNFTPQAVDDKFIREYEGQFKFLLYKTKKAIETNLSGLPLDTRKQAEKLLENWDGSTAFFVNSRLQRVRIAEDKGTINRVHGDFHLGQVMVTPDNDLRFIDFAGEPDLPMAQRKQKHIYVRDVAGMYRSIKGYLGAVAVENFAAKSRDPEVAQQRKKWAEKAIKPLIDRASQAFLGRYDMNEPWLGLEVLRKNLYEVNYEVGNRPEMAYVPIRGLTELLIPELPTAVNENIKTSTKTGTDGR